MTDTATQRKVPRPRACPVCGLTEDALRDTGLMGCAACYDAFPDMVERAVTTLHHTVLAPAPPESPRDDNPWPTRRAR